MRFSIWITLVVLMSLMGCATFPDAADIEVKRSGPVILVDRGATALAPENTLEAYAAAMAAGADGCRVDIRCTGDGVPVLFHDAHSDRVLDGFGSVETSTIAELQSLPFRGRLGLATSDVRVPTFESLCVLAKETGMLLHLVLLNSGFEDQIAAMLEQHGLWDQVVMINGYGADAGSPVLINDERYRPLPLSSSQPDWGRIDERKIHTDGVSEYLPASGEMVIVDDPRLFAHALGRDFGAMPSLPLPTLGAETANGTVPDPGYPTPTPEIEVLLNPALNFWLLNQSDAPATDAQTIFDRAWGARNATRTPTTVTALLGLMENRSLHTDPRLLGLDGAEAMRGLARLRSTQAVPSMEAWLWRVKPDLEDLHPYSSLRPGHHDGRMRLTAVECLGAIGDDEAQFALWGVMDSLDSRFEEVALPFRAEATRSLMPNLRTDADLIRAITHREEAVRGEAILWTLDHGTEHQRQILAEHVPWTAEVIRLPDLRP